MIRRGGISAVLLGILAPAILAIAAVPAQALDCQTETSAQCFALESASASLSGTQAGEHADITTSFQLRRDPNSLVPVPPANAESVTVELPPGVVGNPNALPQCETSQLLTPPAGSKFPVGSCPNATQVGLAEVTLEGGKTLVEPVYNMAPPGSGVTARLAFIAGLFPTFIDVTVRPDDYGVTAKVEGAASLARLVGATTTLWGVPAAAIHDTQRLTPEEAEESGLSGESRPPDIAPVPFLTNPSACGSPGEMRVTATTYGAPGLTTSITAPWPEIDGCGNLGFNPSFAAVPTTRAATSASGLDAKLDLPDPGLLDPKGTANSTAEETVVTLPEGMTINPSQANGLEACREDQLARETAFSAPGAGCPAASKVGTIEVETPLLNEHLAGALYVAQPYENPFGSLIAVYVVIKNSNLGLLVIQPLEVEPDPTTGQLVTTAAEMPPLPFSRFSLHFQGGPRGPLVTPPSCGTYDVRAELTPWSGGAVATSGSTFDIDSGPGGASCPSGTRPFRPDFGAGTVSNSAASYSPFDMRLTRDDGDQELTRFSARLAPGLLAKLAGVSQCPGAAIEAARGRSGRGGGLEELQHPSCPASSLLGDISAGAGVGSILTYAGGKLYLGGPYRGDPLSVVAIVPAIAGPFDFGTVVDREAIRVDPDSGQAEADGPSSDPIPHILAGIPLRVRDIRANLDRPEFTINPTSCNPLAVTATLWGAGIDPFSASDDVASSLSQRFQAADCASLRFKPRLSVRLFGATHRGATPRLKAVLKMPPHGANIAHTQVMLPHDELVDNEHFKSICTRVEFAAHKCHADSIYGFAMAKSPLFDFPLEGPVYLRSAPKRTLPDIVAALRGPASMPIEVDVDGHIDSVNGRLRATFATVPDAPVREFVLSMQGGRKGLIQNSANICAAAHRLVAKFTGQNGRAVVLRPVARPSC